MPGVGKSTLGKKLAKQLQWAFIDLDQEIEKSEGLTIEKIFEEKGELFFRKIERKILLQQQEKTRCIIACGGGTPTYLDNMNWMKEQGLVCYLEANTAFLLSRLNKKNEKRPMFFGLNKAEKEEKIKYLLSHRYNIYEQAHLKISMPIKSLEPLINIAINAF